MQYVDTNMCLRWHFPIYYQWNTTCACSPNAWQHSSTCSDPLTFAKSTIVEVDWISATHMPLGLYDHDENVNPNKCRLMYSNSHDEWFLGSYLKASRIRKLVLTLQGSVCSSKKIIERFWNELLASASSWAAANLGNWWKFEPFGAHDSNEHAAPCRKRQQLLKHPSGALTAPSPQNTPEPQPKAVRDLRRYL
jgi:hypothetical protein